MQMAECMPCFYSMQHNVQQQPLFVVGQVHSFKKVLQIPPQRGTKDFTLYFLPGWDGISAADLFFLPHCEPQQLLTSIYRWTESPSPDLCKLSEQFVQEPEECMAGSGKWVKSAVIDLDATHIVAVSSQAAK